MNNVQGDFPVSAFDFDLPDHLIALRPARPKTSAKLLLARGSATEDRHVFDLPQILRDGDMLVFNDTRVLPVRLSGTRTRGDSVVQVEATLIERLDGERWRAFAKPGRRLKVSEEIVFSADLLGRIEAKREDGTIDLLMSRSGAALDAAMAACGSMPLPPYIASRRPSDAQDDEDYQTIMARRDGAVAAPTAALHFDEALLADLARVGVETATVTLHVGAGTFLPVKAETTGAHVMHAETGEIDAETADRIERRRAQGGRIISVGTTPLRVLETAARETGSLGAWSGSTSIFITPGYKFQAIDGLMTNFHLPCSTLFMLVSALMGLDRMQALYRHAITKEYRFYSYGDSSLLLP